MPRASTTIANVSPEARAGEGLGLWQVAGLLRRSWGWIAVPTLVTALCAVAFVQVVPPRYTGEAKILLESRDASFTRSAQERNEQAPLIDEQAVASQVQVVMSRDLAREAIRRLKLVGNAEFDPNVEGIGPMQRLMMMIGLARNPLSRAPEDRVLDAYFDRLLVYPAGKSRILTVEFRSREAELAALAPNTIAELYIASLESAKADTARYASTWLGGNIEALRTRVAEAEAKVETFRTRNGLIGGGGTLSQPLGVQQLGELSTQLSQARTIKADLNGRAKLIKEMIKDGRAFEIPDVANNEIIRRTVEQRITMRGQLALEARTLLPAHPRIKELTAQISDLDAQIKATAERVVRTMENDARIAETRVDSLTAAVDAQREIVSKGNTSEVQLRALEREAKAQRDQLESYLSRYREASARDAESATPADARVVSRAVVPAIPSFPKKVPIIAFATVLGFLFAAGAVLARHLLADPDAARRGAAVAGPSPLTEPPSPTDGPKPGRRAHPEATLAMSWRGLASSDPFSKPLTAQARFPTVASAGSAAPAPPIPAVAAMQAGLQAAPPVRRSADSASPYDLDLLIARLREGGRGTGGRVLVVEAAQASEEGASEGSVSESLVSGGLASESLASRLAQALAPRARTLLVDLDGPACGPDEVGFTDLVAGDATFLDAIQSVADSHLHTIARGSLDTTVLIEEPQGTAIALDALAQVYDWVVCRLGEAGAPGGRELLSAAGAHMDGIVVASNSDPEDSELGALYALAEAAGTGLVVVAQGRAATEPVCREATEDDGIGLRRSAA